MIRNPTSGNAPIAVVVRQTVCTSLRAFLATIREAFWECDCSPIAISLLAYTWAGRANKKDSQYTPPSIGIPGLDKMLVGGIPERDSILVAGASGTGKSVLATQFVAEGTRQGDPGVVVVFEERSQEYAERASSFGLDLKTPRREKKLEILYLRPLDLSVDETMHEILDSVRKIGAKRLVIDSLAGFEMARSAGQTQEAALDVWGEESSNVFRFRLGPGEISLSLTARVKRPGEELVSEPANLSLVEEHAADEVDAYERLLGDAMHGDGMLFVREDAVEAVGDCRPHPRECNGSAFIPARLMGPF